MRRSIRPASGSINDLISIRNSPPSTEGSLLRFATPCQKDNCVGFKTFQAFKPFNPLLHPPPPLRGEEPGGGRGTELTLYRKPPRESHKNESLRQIRSTPRMQPRANGDRL